MTQVATLIASPDRRNLEPAMVLDICQLLNGTDIKWLSEGLACDITLSGSMTGEQAKPLLTDALAGHQCDFAIQHADKRKKRALIADMDSTMINQECIDELAAEVGLKDRVAAITARAMNGEIEFEPAVIERVALLRGLNTSIIDTIIEKRITLASGGRKLVQTMKANGAYTALVSGGFTGFTSRIAEKLGFDENRANILEAQDGLLTGNVVHPILGADAKVEALLEIAEARNLTPEQFIAVGDGANDLPMLKTAGTGIALHAKPNVAASAKISIRHSDLTSLLYLQGYRDEDFVEN